MHDTWLVVLLVQVFWFSFIGIGWAFLQVCSPLILSVRKLCNVLTHLPVVVSFFTYFATGVALFSIPISLAYIFEWQVVYIAMLYCGAAIFAAVVLFLRRKVLYRLLVQKVRSLNRSQIILGSFLAVAAVFLFVENLSVGGLLNDDTPIHLAKIQLFLNLGHFTFADPALGYNGVVDLRYSTNVLHGLQAVLASLLHAQAYTIWRYSNAVYQLLLVVSLIALVRTYLPKIPKIWVYASILLNPVFNMYVLNEIELPHNYVLLWYSLLLIGLKLLLEKGSSTLVIIAVVLIATTHALSASLVAAFLALLLIVLALMKKITRKQLIVLGTGIGILLIPVIANVSIPDLTKQGPAVTSGLSGLHARALEVTRIGPVVIPKFNLRPDIGFNPDSVINIYTLILYEALLLCVVALRKLQNSRLKQLVLWVLLLVVLARFNYLYFSVVGFVYIVLSIKDLRTKALLLLTVFFFAVLAYDPVVLTLLFGRIPLWAIARSQDINTFAFAAPYLGVFAAYEYARRYWHLPNRFHGYDVAVGMLFIGLILTHSIPLHNSLLSLSRKSNQQDYTLVLGLEKLDPYVKNQVILSDNATVNRLMAVATRGKTFGMVYNYQSSQMQNTGLRSQCYAQLLTTLTYADLKAAKVTRIITTNTPYGLNELARGKLYLKLTKQVGRYTVYSVQSDQVATHHSTVCPTPYRQ